MDNAKHVREFVLAGNATITLESERTGVHFTYRVRQATDDNDRPTNRWFVSVLCGPDNESGYAYIGLLDYGRWAANYLDPDGPVGFRQTAKSRFGADAPSVRGFAYFWSAISRGAMPCHMVVRHEGKCGRCGRTLTVPESIDLGIGPECADKMGIDRAKKAAPAAKRDNRVVASLADAIREYAA